MNNLDMGLFNNFEATLHEPLTYVNNLHSTDEADFQSVMLVPKDTDKWPVDIATYFTSNPCFVYMTFFSEGSKHSAMYKVFFNNTTTVDGAGIITTKCVLEEQPGFGRDIPALVSWPIGTLISCTASKQVVGAFANIAEGAAEEVDVRLSALIQANTDSIALNTAASTKNTQDILTNTASIAINKDGIKALVDANTAQDVKIKANEDAVIIFTNMVSEEVGADRIPKSNDEGKISAAWIEGFTPNTLTEIATEIGDINNKFSTTMAGGKAPLALSDGTFDESWKMGGGSGGGGMPIGAIIPVTCTSTYTPFGMVPCDGTTYTAAQFPNVVEYITDNSLPWKSFAEYTAALTADGKAGFFGYDAASASFRVPLIPNGTFIQQAQGDGELGKAYGAGLPNIEGDSAGFIRTIISGSTSGALTKSTTANKIDGPQSLSTSDSVSGYAFDASLSNPIYGNSETVQPASVALRYFVVVATETDNQSVMDWSAWATGLAGKANVDLSNVDASALENIGVGYKIIYGTGQKAVYDPDNINAIEDDALGTNGTVTKASRYLLDNPFGILTPVIVEVEVYVSGLWGRTGWVFGVSGQGTNGGYIENNGIYVQTGGEFVYKVGSQSGGAFSSNGTSAPCRVHVWKIGV